MTLAAPERTRSVTFPRETKVCNDCGTVLRKPAPVCRLCDAEVLVATIRDLTAPRPASTFAVWELRDRGLTARQVLRVRQELLRGREPYEVVTVLEGLEGA